MPNEEIDFYKLNLHFQLNSIIFFLIQTHYWGFYIFLVLGPTSFGREQSSTPHSATPCCSSWNRRPKCSSTRTPTIYTNILLVWGFLASSGFFIFSCDFVADRNPKRSSSKME
ncbi:hypothetical protein RchiOBHm_Chr4g0442491 [Rosa chinensis]|uniref:Uncharacterized protein n=1 Tax=Rosa chinensis TaxID=74649 RepID=A0A2P6R3J7_ROSCH|nr:hypothetical protein RchiOBHm_Chr4g0442491 [Rosa chinensis]